MEKQAVQTIKTSSLIPNSWNTNIVSPENQAKIEESIKRFGMFKPLVCRTLPSGDIEILGGQHRWEAAKALGVEEVSIVNLGVIDDKKAKEISLIDNGRYGSDDVTRLSELLRDLGSADEIADYLPYSTNDLTQLFSAVEVDLDALSMDDSDEDVDREIEELTKKTPTYTVMRFKVPIDDAERVQNVINGIAQRQGFTSSDSLTNAGDALVYLCGNLKDAV